MISKFFYSIKWHSIRQIFGRNICDFCLSRDYWNKYVNRPKLEKILKLITVNPRYNAALFIALTFFWTKFHLTHYIDLPSKIAVMEEWKLWTHLMLYASIVTKLKFPSGRAFVILKQSILFSKSLGECKSMYQGREPENCVITKFVTQFCWVELLNFNGLYLY